MQHGATVWHRNAPSLSCAAVFAHAAWAQIQLVMTLMERRGVTRGRAFAVPGIALWVCLMRGGVNADIAGVLTGLCVHAKKGDTRSLDRLTKRWTSICGLAIMPLFALANTGVPLKATTSGSVVRGVAATATAGNPSVVSLGIFLGLMLGKPLG